MNPAADTINCRDAEDTVSAGLIPSQGHQVPAENALRAAFAEKRIPGSQRVRAHNPGKYGLVYTFCPDGLGRESLVYSGGVGSDVSFEHALVRQFGCSVVLVDPSPIGLATMDLPENKVPQFRFFPVGLAGHCGTLRLAPPFTIEGDSWFLNNNLTETSEVRCLDLATLMKQNGHEHLDLLKVDIEGAEYGVIDQILDRGIPVRQILVEFHDGILPGIGLRQSLWAIFRLLAHGYKMVWETGNVHAFILGRVPTRGKT